ncbi:hypothetical protein PQD13_gp03 [Gordonia phage Clawz]|uniref:Uncharacterized protein n=1 Tax=Gordonia phage Clawz TaxID=2743910 RepID=A0AAE7K6W3_9CAUD|nr:hypothetical protein PQD13_gp03 [Gordonia phage Clawz]QKY79915.1 hypothetical protein SEA_CLAWZ_3 [Gordonia phage Clawz]
MQDHRYSAVWNRQSGNLWIDVRDHDGYLVDCLPIGNEHDELEANNSVFRAGWKSVHGHPDFIVCGSPLLSRPVVPA